MADIQASPFLYPILAHIAWIVFIYTLLTVVRAPDAWGIGLRADGTNPMSSYEPKITANLRNQFEWPVVFYLICVFLVIEHNTDSLQIGLAWLFIAGRLLHSYVHIFLNNIRLRGIVFSINFVAVLGMWGVFLV